MPSAAILAGGRARRFDGRDKSALLVDGRSILERQIDALTPLTSDILIVRARGVSSASTDTRVRLVNDSRDDAGPLAGLETALTEANDPVLVLLACDMPFVTTDLVGYLAAVIHGADAAVPRTTRGVHPLCAAYGRQCLTAVRRRLDQGRLAMKDLLEDLRVRTVDDAELGQFGNPQRLLANVNTPDDYASLAAPHGSHSR